MAATVALGGERGDLKRPPACDGCAAVPFDHLETRLASRHLSGIGMAQRTIRFRIRPDGRVEETVEGLAGSACEQLTERIEARLGTVQQRRETAEAFQAADLDALQPSLLSDSLP